MAIEKLKGAITTTDIAAKVNEIIDYVNSNQPNPYRSVKSNEDVKNFLSEMFFNEKGKFK